MKSSSPDVFSFLRKFLCTLCFSILSVSQSHASFNNEVEAFIQQSNSNGYNEYVDTTKDILVYDRNRTRLPLGDFPLNQLCFSNNVLTLKEDRSSHFGQRLSSCDMLKTDNAHCSEDPEKNVFPEDQDIQLYKVPRANNEDTTAAIDFIEGKTIEPSWIPLGGFTYRIPDC